MSDETALALIEDLEEEALVLQVEVESIPAIADNATFEMAAGYRTRAKGLIEAIKAKHEPEKKAKRAEWQEKVDAEKAELAGPEALLEALNTRMGAWNQQQAREKRMAEVRAAEEARQIEAARPKPAAGAPPLPPVVVPAARVEMPKVAGLSFTPHYDVVEDVDAGGRRALINGVAAGWGSPMVLEPNMPMLKDMARQAKGDIAIPGYKVVVTNRPRG